MTDPDVVDVMSNRIAYQEQASCRCKRELDTIYTTYEEILADFDRPCFVRSLVERCQALVARVELAEAGKLQMDALMREVEGLYATDRIESGHARQIERAFDATLQEALAVSAMNDKQLHAAGYPWADRARADALEVLAGEVGKRMEAEQTIDPDAILFHKR